MRHPAGASLASASVSSVMPPIVRTTGIGKQYRPGHDLIHAVSDISLIIERGEFVAILGRSGSGKSTLLALLGLLESPDTGEYRLNTREVGRLSDADRATLRNREIGFVFQLPMLLPRASALENVALPLVYGDNVGWQERLRRAGAALDRVGLSRRQQHRPSQLSGGEQQRVVIARALINNPALILADEPTGALDTRTADEILKLFEELNRDGSTIVVVTHAPEVAARAARRIMMEDGKIATAPVLVPISAMRRR